MRGFMQRRRMLGQVFLINTGVAEAEAEHAHGKVVLEIGPGKGILTSRLCKNAKRVIAVERDRRLYELLKTNGEMENLKLINKDILETGDEELELDKIDIVISNVPYSISGKIIEWLWNKRKSAVLCLQKEFVEHMMAGEGTEKYSHLSVMSALLFRVVEIMRVPRNNFRPIPKVDSAVIYIEPKNNQISQEQRNIIKALMIHKKKTVKNALVDSSSQLGKSSEYLKRVGEKLDKRDERVFRLSPIELLDLSKAILNQKS